MQRLPLSFFTRTQTGALMSRLNNDVIGAQQAVTNTMGTVVSNAISLVVTLTFMLVLEWRLTILTLLVLPLFIIPARRVGRKLQVLTRESMQLNAAMNNTVAERFNVAGALVVKLFGSHDREQDLFSGRAGRVRDIGMRERACSLESSSSAWASSRPSAPRSSTTSVVDFAIDGVIAIGTVAAFVVYVGQIYTPLTQLTNARVDVLTALVSFERVFEVLDFPPLVAERAGAVELPTRRGSHRVRPRVVPPPAGRGVVDRLARRERRDRRRGGRRVDPARRARSRWSPASSSRSSVRRAPARRRPHCSSRASTTSSAAACSSTGTTCAT